MKKKRKIIVIAVVAVLIAVAVIAAVFIYRGRRSSKAGGDLYVDTVAAIMGEESGSDQENRFAGVIESKDSWNVTLNDGGKVAKLHVAVGDAVKKGDPLFDYDTDQLSEDEAQAEIDLARLKNERSSIATTITQLNAEKKKASAADQGIYTVQIQEQELDAKKKDIEISEKEAALAKIRRSIDNATVTSKIDGVVKTIDRAQMGTDESSGEEDVAASGSAFMTIMQTDSLRVKASVNEQNVADISEGMDVVIHSRVDDKTWNGTITTVETDSPQANEQSQMGDMSEDGSESGQTSSSVYPFYVDIEDGDGLMIGQHVYIEVGGGEAAQTRDGIWLDEGFILDADSDPYVLLETKKGSYQNHPVTLGDYDEEMMQYEVTDGLKKTDRIAYPSEEDAEE